MNKYLVTGGAGFIGSHLVDALLAAGHSVDVLDDLSTGKRKNLSSAATLIEGSVTDGPLVHELMSKADGCFHLAAIASVERCNTDWIATHKVNMTGAVTILEAAGRYKLPVVYASTAAVYGNPQDFPIMESSPMQPLSAYGADKRGIELHAQVGWHVHGIPSVGMRFFNVYGPRQNPRSPYSGVISIFASRLAAGEGITIFGDGKQSRDFIYVDDVVRALMLGMNYLPSPRWEREGAQPVKDGKGEGNIYPSPSPALRAPSPIGERVHIFNVCTGSETSLLQLTTTLGEILQVDPKIAFAPARAGDIQRSVGDPSLLKSQLGFKPFISLQEGLSAILADKKEHPR